jgi:hypothetical protein
LADLIKRLEDLDEDQLARIYMEVFNTEPGKLIIEDLKNRCFFDISTIVENQMVDPLTMARNEGRRSVLLHLLTQLKPRETAE